MQIVPYLTFDGNCAEAFRFYADLLGGTVDIRTFGDSPIADDWPAEAHERVMHARLEADGAVLMASDTPPGQAVQPRDIHVSLQIDDAGDAERIFQTLAEGGTVTMPIEKTFWAERFGMLVDRWGIPWMVNCEGAA